MLSGMNVTWWLARIALGLLALSVVAGSVGVTRFQARATRVHDVPEPRVRAEATPEVLARGRHLATTLGGCTECHGPNLAGRVMDDNPMLRLSPPNITPKGVVAGYADRDWYRAIVHGVTPSGRSLAIMPSKELRTFSDDDVLAIIAYMKSVPPVANDVPPTRVSLLGKAVLGLAGEELWAANQIRHDEPHAGRITPTGPTVTHGEYLINMCKGCHGQDLRGGKKMNPDAPPTADISPPVMASWSREQLEAVLRQGKKRDGTPVDDAMPWRATRELTDDELTAIWLALRE